MNLSMNPNMSPNLNPNLLSPFAAFGQFPGFPNLPAMPDLNAGLASNPLLASMAQFMQPTLDPAELEKRLTELKTVAQWMEMNLGMLKNGIQALEIQKATLAAMQQFAAAGQSMANNAAQHVTQNAQAAAGTPAQSKAATVKVTKPRNTK